MPCFQRFPRRPMWPAALAPWGVGKTPRFSQRSDLAEVGPTSCLHVDFRLWVFPMAMYIFCIVLYCFRYIKCHGTSMYLNDPLFRVTTGSTQRAGWWFEPFSPHHWEYSILISLVSSLDVHLFWYCHSASLTTKSPWTNTSQNVPPQQISSQGQSKSWAHGNAPNCWGALVGMETSQWSRVVGQHSFLFFFFRLGLLAWNLWSSWSSPLHVTALCWGLFCCWWCSLPPRMAVNSWLLCHWSSKSRETSESWQCKVPDVSKRLIPRKTPDKMNQPFFAAADISWSTLPAFSHD